jgi:L-rhamnose isomerase/sugar isomerase
MGANDAESRFDLLDRMPVEISSLAPVPLDDRLRARADCGTIAPATDRIVEVAGVLKAQGPWNRVARHLPWDAATPEEAKALVEVVREQDLTVGTVLFEMPSLPTPGAEGLGYGSLASPDETVRDKAMQGIQEALAIMRALGGRTLALWLPDGWDSPGQVSYFETALRIEETLMRFYATLTHDEWLLLKCGTPGPARYHTPVSHAGRAMEICGKLGFNARVLLNSPSEGGDRELEQTVAFLLRSDTFGGVHFTGLPYGGVHPLAGRYDPWRTFRTALTLLEGEHLNYAPIDGISLIVDRLSNTPNPEGEISSVLKTLSQAFLRAENVDLFALAEARGRPWTGEADRLVDEAFAMPTGDVLADYLKARGLGE